VQPLVAMVNDLAVTGAITARVNYGARGWVAHHNTDLWRASGPIDGAKWGMWPTGGAWLCKHLWDHYDYGRDRAYLAEVYPLLKGAAQFFLDTLVKDPTGKFLVTSPSISPENLHPYGAATCAGPAMDSQILRDLFANCIHAAEILGLDAGFRAACAATRAKLPPDRIGKAGQLQEWMEDWDMEAPERTHRHVSHLYALFPGEQITVRRTPELAAAVRRSLELRGDLSTGWAIAWRINLWAYARRDQTIARPVAHLSQHVRCASPVSDRRQFWRCQRNDGDAAAVCGWGDRAVAGVAAGVGYGVGARVARAWGLRGGYCLA
jgi:alpha-L-fucosidase 2